MDSQSCGQLEDSHVKRSSPVTASLLATGVSQARFAATGKLRIARGGAPDGGTDGTDGRGRTRQVAESQRPFALPRVARPVPSAWVSPAASGQRGCAGASEDWQPRAISGAKQSR